MAAIILGTDVNSIVYMLLGHLAPPLFLFVASHFPT